PPGDAGLQALDVGGQRPIDAPPPMDRPPPPDAAPPPDFGPLPTALPIPDGMAPPRRLLEPGDTLTGGGRSSCSHQQPASGNGDRWCAFWRKGATPPAADLWVINL